MKILFVYPNVTSQRSPQLGICMIASVARQLGHECFMFDLTCIPHGKEVSRFKSIIGNIKPNLLAVSCRSNEWPMIEKLFRSADLSNIIKVFGGPHATVAPEETLEIADIVVIGEGEDTFSELLKRIEDGKDISKVAGTWTKKDGNIIKNDMRDLISDLDDLPFPYWNIFDKIHFEKSYVMEHFKGAKIVGTFETTRGCPYGCTYCTNDYVRGLYKGKGKWRREKSPERIIEEVKQFRDEYGLDGIYWIDEVVLTNIDRLKKFKDLYISEIGVPFVFMERPENMTDEKVSIIKQAGAKMVSIGIESGDENIRRNLLNRHHSQETIINAFQTAKKYGLTTYAFTMIGFPDEDRESIKNTFNLLKQAQPDKVQTTIFFPLGKTKLYEKTVSEGLFDPRTPMPRHYYDKSCLNFSVNKKRELLLWQYIIANYKSRFSEFLIKSSANPLIINIFILFHKIYFKLVM
jgi:radical SAM superfamily enzyme YgiQ (UPF0313 family)